MVVGSGAGDVGIARVAGTVVEVVPAVDEGGAGAAGGGTALEVLGEGQREGAAERRDATAEGPGAGVAAADTADIDVQVAAGGQAREGIGGVEDAVGDVAEVRLDAGGAPGDLILVSSGAAPSEVDRVGGDVGSDNIADTVAVGEALHREVVEVRIAVDAVGRHDGDAAACAGVVGQGNLEAFPQAQLGGSGCAHKLEGGGILGIGHHAHLDGMGVGGVGPIEIEGDHRAVDGQVELRQHHVAVGTAGGVHVQRAAAGRAAMVVAGLCVGIVGAVVGLLVPADRERVAAAGGEGLEVLVVGNVDGETGSGQGDGVGAILSAAVCADAELVVRGGVEVGEVVGGGGHRAFVHPGTRALAVGDFPGGLVVAGQPADVDVGGGGGVEEDGGGTTGGILQTAEGVQLHVGTVADTRTARDGREIIRATVVIDITAHGCGSAVVVPDIAATHIGARVVVHHNQQVAGAVILEVVGEGEGGPSVIARLAIEVARIDHLEGRGVIRHEGRTEVADRDIGQIDGAVGLVSHCRSIAILELDAADGGGTVQLGSENQLLGVGVVVEIIDRHVVVGAGRALVEGERGGLGGIGGLAAKAVGGEVEGVAPGAVAVGHAVAADDDMIGAARGETGDDEALLIGREALGSLGGVFGDNLYLKLLGGAGEALADSPLEDGASGGRCGGLEGEDVGAERCLTQLDVVDVGIPAGGVAQGADGHMLAIAGVVGKGGRIFSPLRAVAHVDGAHVREGGDIVGVVHHTHLEDGAVARAAGLGPEEELEGLDIEDIGIDRGQDDVLVVAVGAGGGGVVPIETLAAARGVVVAAAAHIGVAEIGRSVVQTGEAGGETGVGVAAGGHGILEVEDHGE